MNGSDRESVDCVKSATKSVMWRWIVSRGDSELAHYTIELNLAWRPERQSCFPAEDAAPPEAR